ncbi:MAG: TIGR03936 family radical SAM-associated protein [Bacillota bacterium]|nr:TIGR03936 family radical SAM-associated protein [Bacillota bacterium]
MYHYLLSFSKEGDIKFISHLDLMRTFIRALRRAEMPVAYSQGFSPQPRLTFAAPLAVGLEARNEYLDLYMTEAWQNERILQALNGQFPLGLKVKAVHEVELEKSPLSSLINAALYIAILTPDPGDFSEALQNILRAEIIMKVRWDKKGEKTLDIRPFIYHLKIGDSEEGTGKLLMLLATGNKGGARPEEILELLPLPGIKARVYREALFFPDKGRLLTPEGISSEEYMER